MKVCLAEQLIHIIEARSFKGRVERAKLYDTRELRIIADLVFNPFITIEVLDEFKWEPSKDSEMALVYRFRQEAPKLQNLTNVGPYPNLEVNKRTGILIKILESIHPKDAELLINIVKKKSLGHHHLNKELFAEVFPDLAMNWE